MLVEGITNNYISQLVRTDEENSPTAGDAAKYAL